VNGKALALIEIAEQYRAEHCAALLASAESESRRLLADAHRLARRHLRATLDAERARLAEVLAEAQAQLVTARRARAQKRMAAALAQAWPRIERALAQRWQSPSGRAIWVEQHLAVAKEVLPAAAWTILHPPQWPDAEREQAEHWLQAHGIADARFATDATLSAGIRVVCATARGMNLLDASIEGLLADRTGIEGRLLHHLGEFA